MRLIIIDIDNTFIYHRTVAIANKLFLEELYKACGIKWSFKRIYTTRETLKIFFKNIFRIKLNRHAKKLFILSISGLLLYIIEWIRKLYNFISYKLHLPRISSNISMIIWDKTLGFLDVKNKEYWIDKKIIEKSIYKNMREKLRRLKKNSYIVAISEHISAGKDPIKDMLWIDELHENRMKNGKVDYVVKGPKDKLKIAKKVIKKINPNEIILFIDDYDDYSLLELEKIKKIIKT